MEYVSNIMYTILYEIFEIMKKSGVILINNLFEIYLVNHQKKKILVNHTFSKVNSDINVYKVITNLILSNEYERGKRALIDLMFPPNNP